MEKIKQHTRELALDAELYEIMFDRIMLPSEMSIVKEAVRRAGLNLSNYNRN
jgi:hypothetical protein